MPRKCSCGRGRGAYARKGERSLPKPSSDREHAAVCAVCAVGPHLEKAVDVALDTSSSNAVCYWRSRALDGRQRYLYYKTATRACLAFLFPRSRSTKHVKKSLISLSAALLLFTFHMFPSDDNGAFIADTQGRIDGKCKQCKDEAKEGVFHLIHSQKCSHTGCSKYPSYGFKAGGKKRRCADHAAQGMTNLLKKCEECRKTASYSFPGLARTHCGQHKKNGMAGPSKGTAEPPVVPQPRAPATAVDVAAAAFVAAGVTATESSASPGAGSAVASDVEPAIGAEQGISRLSVLVSAAEAAGVQGCEVGSVGSTCSRFVCRSSCRAL